MTQSKIPVAVLGCGHLGTFHARILQAHPEAQLVAVVDQDLARAKALAEELGCRALSDPAELSGEIQAASVAVPTSAHAAVSVPLLEAGIACLVEKPLADTLEHADAILAAAESSGALLAVGHVERFQPGVRVIRELGLRPKFVECHRLAPISFRSLDIGVVHDLMIHDLDLVLDLVGSEVVSIDAAGGAILTEREDVASVRLVFENGARANVTASRASLKPMRRFRMFSSQGYVSLDFTTNEGLMVRKGKRFAEGKRLLRDLSPFELLSRKDEILDGTLDMQSLRLDGHERPLQAEIASFLSSVKNGTAPEVTGHDGRRALELAERISAAIQEASW